jgi:hypothetical protein
MLNSTLTIRNNTPKDTKIAMALPEKLNKKTRAKNAYLMSDKDFYAKYGIDKKQALKDQ